MLEPQLLGTATLALEFLTAIDAVFLDLLARINCSRIVTVVGPADL